MKTQSRRAQTLVEYALLFIVLTGALVAMKVYLGRALHEHFRQSADVFGGGDQYVKGQTHVTANGTVGLYDMADNATVIDPCVLANATVARLTKDVYGCANCEPPINGTLKDAKALLKQAADMSDQTGVLEDNNVALFTHDVEELSTTMSESDLFSSMTTLQSRVQKLLQLGITETVNASDPNFGRGIVHGAGEMRRTVAVLVTNGYALYEQANDTMAEINQTEADHCECFGTCP